MDTGSYFEAIDTRRYKPTAHVSGAWDPGEQHFGPLGGLIVHAMERHVERHLADRPEPRPALSRISFGLGRLALDECEIRVETIRPGRTIELLEAVALIADRPVVRARAWLLASCDTSAVAGGAPAALAPPERFGSRPLTDVWPGGYIASPDVRPLAPPRPGRATARVSTGLDHGIAVRRSPTDWMFPNVDLTIHLHRRPEGRWTGLDTTVAFGPTGQGVTSTVLHDVTGPVGHAQQILTVRPLPADGT